MFQIAVEFLPDIAVRCAHELRELQRIFIPVREIPCFLATSTNHTKTLALLHSKQSAFRCNHFEYRFPLCQSACVVRIKGPVALLQLPRNGGNISELKSQISRTSALPFKHLWPVCGSPSSSSCSAPDGSGGVHTLPVSATAQIGAVQSPLRPYRRLCRAAAGRLGTTRLETSRATFMLAHHRPVWPEPSLLRRMPRIPDGI